MSNHCSSLDGAAAEWSQEGRTGTVFFGGRYNSGCGNKQIGLQRSRGSCISGAPPRGLAPGGKGVLQEFGINPAQRACCIGLFSKRFFFGTGYDSVSVWFELVC